MAAPFGVSYAIACIFAAERPSRFFLFEQNSFRLTPEDLEKAITPRTRWVLVTSPCNPSVTSNSANDYRATARCLARHPQVWGHG